VIARDSVKHVSFKTGLAGQGVASAISGKFD
jgi:hypothetical protein